MTNHDLAQQVIDLLSFMMKKLIYPKFEECQFYSTESITLMVNHLVFLIIISLVRHPELFGLRSNISKPLIFVFYLKKLSNPIHALYQLLILSDKSISR